MGNIVAVDEQFVHHMREHPGQRQPGTAEPGEGLRRVVTPGRRQHEVDVVVQHPSEPARVALGEIAQHLVVEAVDALYRGRRYRLGQARHVKGNRCGLQQHGVQEGHGGHVGRHIGH